MAETPKAVLPQKPEHLCSICDGADWWQLPLEKGGWWRCAKCHPSPDAPVERGLTIYDHVMHRGQ